MKKLLNNLFIIFFLLFIIGFISNGFPSLMGIHELQYVDKIETDSDDMLLEEGQFMLSLKETSVQFYFNSSTFSSKQELECLYKDFVKKYNDFYENSQVDDKMKIYLCLVNDFNQSMYIYGNAYFDESYNLKRINFSWYDENEIFDAMNNGSVQLGITSKCFLGSTLKISSDSILAMEGNFDGELKYMKLNTLSSNIRRICNSIYTDLFEVRKSVTSDNNIIYNGNGIQNIDISYLNMIYNGYPVWDIDSFGKELPYERIFNTLYDDSLEDEGSKEIQDALILKYRFTNNSSLKDKVFYLIIDSKLDYVGLNIYENNKYDLIYYIDSNNEFISDTLYYDLTNYHLVEETILLGKSIVYSTSDNQMFHERSKILSGICEESDFPIYLNKVFGYDELNNYIFELIDSNEKYYVYDLFLNRTLEFETNEIGEIYYDFDNNKQPIPLNDYSLELNLEFKKGYIYVINGYTYLEQLIEQEDGFKFLELYNTSSVQLKEKGFYELYGSDFNEYYSGNYYESNNEIEKQLSINFKNKINKCLGYPNYSNLHYASLGSNIVLIPNEDFTLTLTNNINIINQYIGLHLEIATAKLY